MLTGRSAWIATSTCGHCPNLSNDVVNRMRQGKPVKMVYPDQGKNQLGCLILPNAAVLIRNSPHPDAGRKLIDYLLSRDTERKLAFADCAQIPLHSGIETPSDVPRIDRLTTTPVDYGAAARKLQAIQPAKTMVKTILVHKFNEGCTVIPKDTRLHRRHKSCPRSLGENFSLPPQPASRWPR